MRFHMGDGGSIIVIHTIRTDHISHVIVSKLFSSRFQAPNNGFGGVGRGPATWPGPRAFDRTYFLGISLERHQVMAAQNVSVEISEVCDRIGS